MYSVGFTERRCIFIEETHVHLKLAHILHVKCLGNWNASIGVDEGKNATQPTSVQVLLMAGSK